MNRWQRRKLKIWNGGKGVPERQKNNVVDFSAASLEDICKGVQFLIDELNRRDSRIHDFDHKEKTVKAIRIIGSRVYFLATEDKGNEEA